MTASEWSPMVLDRSAWAVRVPRHQPVKLASEVGYGNGFASSGQARVPEPQPQAANSTRRSAMEVPIRARSAATPGLGITLVGGGRGAESASQVRDSSTHNINSAPLSMDAVGPVENFPELSDYVSDCQRLALE